MRFFDPSHPFFKPAGRRYAVVAAPLAWAGVELAFDQPVWAAVFAVIGIYLAWQLIFAWKG